MAPYLIAFAATICIFSLVSGFSRHSIGYKFWFLIGILIPCILAALRAKTIGTDVSEYASPLFDLATSNNSFNHFYNSQWFRWYGSKVSGPYDFEIGYVVLVWFCAKVFGSLQGLLFTTQALTIAPIAIAAGRCKERASLPLIITLYLLLYFNTSLNMMRQWIAMALIFLALVGLYKTGQGLRGNAKALIACMTAPLFHTAALLGILVLLLRVYLDDVNGDCAKRGYLVCICCSLLVIMLGPVSTFLNSIGLGYYVNSYLGNQAITFMPNQVILRLPMLFYSALLIKRNGSKDSKSIFLFCMIFSGVVLSQLLSLGANSGRIAIFFDMFSMAVPPLLFGTYEKCDARRPLLVLTVVLYCLIYWDYFYVISGSSETIPYLFYWQ